MKQYHPICNFIYFFCILGLVMFIKHPIYLLIGFASGLLYMWQLFGMRESAKGLVRLLFLMVFTAVINPAFSHQGVTVITELPTGNYLTLESILYGLGMACKLGTVLLWFRCMSEILTEDKIIYLFGRTFPVLGLLLSMALGFIPKMQKKLREFDMARGEVKNLKQGVERLYMLITWSLEDAIIQADCMKSRGYGLEGRTFFTRFRFTGRDKKMVLLLAFLFLWVLAALYTGHVNWHYYPELPDWDWNTEDFLYGTGYVILCVLPVWMEKYEEIKWNSLQSAI